MKISNKIKGGVNSGTLYVVLILLIVGALSFELIGGKLPSPQTTNPNGQQVIVDTPTPDPNGSKKDLQLYTFSGHPPTPPVDSSLCKSGGRNEHGSMLGSSPASGGNVVDGKLRIWVIDERAPLIAPGQTVDSNGIPQGGDLSKKNPDGFLPGPQLYISPNTFESGGAAHFPNTIKGTVSNGPNTFNGPSIDSDYKQFENGPDHINNPVIDVPGRPAGYEGENVAEFIWNVNSLGLGSGTYQAQFVAYDGDGDRAAGCANITVQ